MAVAVTVAVTVAVVMAVALMVAVTVVVTMAVAVAVAVAVTMAVTVAVTSWLPTYHSYQNTTAIRALDFRITPRSDFRGTTALLLLVLLFVIETLF